LVETVAYKLGVLPSYLSAELDKLVYVEKGGHIERGSDNEDVLGSLFIQLPSKFKGGEMTVYNANSSFKFPLGAGGGMLPTVVLFGSLEVPLNPA